MTRITANWRRPASLHTAPNWNGRRDVTDTKIRIDMPLPESLVEHEIEHRRESLERDLDQAGLTMQSYAESRQVSPADLEKEIADDVRRSVKARFILDQLAEQEDLGIEQEEIGQYITQLAYQQGVPPDQFARQLTSSNQLGAVVADVLRSKAADLLAERVKVADESGRKVVVGQAAGVDGESLEAFLDEHGHGGMARGAVVVVCSDGFEVGDPALLAGQMARLHRLAHRVVWLNPLTATPGYEPAAAGMQAATPFPVALARTRPLSPPRRNPEPQNPFHPEKRRIAKALDKMNT